MTDTSALILIRRLRVQNANAISGPLTWGFPSPTAFTGFVHALQRRLGESPGAKFGGVGVVCHDFQPQVSESSPWKPRTFNLTRNPVGKDGGTMAIVEEGRAHLEVSLVVEVRGYLDEDDLDELCDRLAQLIPTMRLAGGSIMTTEEAAKNIEAYLWSGVEDADTARFRTLRRRLLPGFALVQREDILVQHLDGMRNQNSEATVLDALLDLSRVNIEPEPAADPDQGHVGWGIRKKRGWLVPVPVGYAAISPLYEAGTMANARDPHTAARFVESVYSLGEWVSPHRLTRVEQMLWHNDADPDAGIYRCNNRFEQFNTPDLEPLT